MNDPAGTGTAEQINDCQSTDSIKNDPNVPLNIDLLYSGENLAQGRRLPHSLCVILIVFFIGILLSMTLNFGISAWSGTMDLCDDYYDGASHEDIVLSSFSDVFYKNREMRTIITNYDYILFGNLNTNDVILGKNEFLFERYDKVHDYNYIADYIGEYSDKDGEVKEIAEGILRLRKKYDDIGVGCTVVVIPNIHTVYCEMMPDFFGTMSPQTRLAKLTQYMDNVGCTDYIDTREALIAAKSEGRLYNNTENSLNARGAYHVYLEVIRRLSEDGNMTVPDCLTLSERDLVSHVTAGKELAREVGLPYLIRNLTVSLSGEFTQRYEAKKRVGSVSIVGPKEEFRDLLPDSPSVLFEFTESNEWDRILLTDYFSNTFGQCGYRTSAEFSTDAVQSINASRVIIFVHENELSVFTDTKNQ